MLGTLLLARCTLHPGPPTIVVRVAKATPGPERSPDLASLKCFGIVIAGAPNPVGSPQVDDRDPVCLKLNGAFFGPYSYDEIAGKEGVRLPVAVGNYDFSLVAFDRASGCGSSLSDLYFGTPAETYAVASPVTVDLAQTSQVVLRPNLYSATSTNLTAACPPATFSCDNTMACDTFTDVQGTSLAAHVMPVGSGWLFNAMTFNTIDENDLNVLAQTNTNAGEFYTQVADAEMEVRADIDLGVIRISQVGVTARRESSDTLVLAYVERNLNQLSCQLVLGEILPAGQTTLATATIPYNDCGAGQYSTIRLQAGYGRYDAYYRGTHVFTTTTTTTIDGLYGGIWARFFGSVTEPPRADNFSIKFLPAARPGRGKAIHGS